jgi:hypothetical protein
MRSSLHDPLLVLNVESETHGGVATATHVLHGWLAAQQRGGGAAAGVDLAPLATLFAPGGKFEHMGGHTARG